MKWPFTKLEEGESVTIWEAPPYLTSIMAHNTARRKGWKVRTRTVEGEDGELGCLVMRVTKEGPSTEDQYLQRTLRVTRFGTMDTYEYDKLEVGEYCIFTHEVHGPEVLSKVISGIYKRAQVQKRRYKVQTQRGTVTVNGMDIPDALSKVQVTRVA